MYPEGNKQTNKHMTLWSRTSDSTCFQDPGFSSLKWEEPFLLCGFVLKICECIVKYLNVLGTHSTQLSLLRKGSKKLLGCNISSLQCYKIWMEHNCACSYLLALSQESFCCCFSAYAAAVEEGTPQHPPSHCAEQNTASVSLALTQNSNQCPRFVHPFNKYFLHLLCHPWGQASTNNFSVT